MTGKASHCEVSRLQLSLSLQFLRGISFVRRQDAASSLGICNLHSQVFHGLLFR